MASKTKSQGILSQIPSSWIPYAELMRLHKPVGIFNIYFPYLYGSLYAATVRSMSLENLIAVNMILFPVGFMIRSVGCAWNDIMDKDLDKKVARCRSRPMARGALTASQGYMFCTFLTLGWIALLGLFGIRATAYGLVAITLAAIYPFAKRFTDYAQVFLGVTLGWGTLVGCQAQGVDPFARTDASFFLGLGSLYLSYTTWTVIHDTIYAFQDVQDDKKAGIKSLSVRFQKSTAPLLFSLSLVEVLLHALTGYYMGASWPYYVICCLGSAILLSCMVLIIDLQDPSQCWGWFKGGSLGIGCIIASAMIVEYLVRL